MGQGRAHQRPDEAAQVALCGIADKGQPDLPPVTPDHPRLHPRAQPVQVHQTAFGHGDRAAQPQPPLGHVINLCQHAGFPIDHHDGGAFALSDRVALHLGPLDLLPDCAATTLAKV
jgi:hypothetical protein